MLRPPSAGREFIRTKHKGTGNLLAKTGITGDTGIGYGDSYIMDPHGEIMVRSKRHEEDFIMADVDAAHGPDMSFGLSKSAWSHHEFGSILAEAMKQSPYAKAGR